MKHILWVAFLVLLGVGACQVGSSSDDGESITIEMSDGDDKATIELGRLQVDEDGIEFQGAVSGESGDGEGSASGRITIDRHGLRLVSAADGRDGDDRGEAAGSITIGRSGVHISGDATGGGGDASGSVSIDSAGIRIAGDGRGESGKRVTGSLGTGPVGLSLDAELPTACARLCEGWNQATERRASCIDDALAERGYSVSSSSACQSMENELECVSCAASLGLSSSTCADVADACLR